VFIIVENIVTSKAEHIITAKAGINVRENNSTIILANGMTMDELNNEKNKTINKVANKR
jgi:hypothetical protein